MNQIQKRLGIINNAISITDAETIQLQLLKLLKFRKTDTAVEEIIDTLTSENFVKAQRLIQNYLQTSSRNATQERQILIDQFDLFDAESETSSEIIDINDFFLNHSMPRNQSETEPDPFFEMDHKMPSEEPILDLDTFFEAKKIPLTKEEDNEDNDDTKPTLSVDIYPKIPQISKKLLYMNQLYTPLVYDEDEIYETVEALLDKIAMEGYTESDIEDTLIYIEQLTHANHLAEAAQLLLACASTESKFGQFMLGRALYQGVLFEKNMDASFEQIHNLAMTGYPEAWCDLGQFYEHGIGTKKSLKQAKKCYKEALDLGIQRAEPHYRRLKRKIFLF